METRMTRTMALYSIIPAFFLTPLLAAAQASESAYCSALSQKYTQYLDGENRLGRQPGNLGARAAVEKCKAGDTSGIPAIEKALKDAKIDLPSRQ